MSLDLSALNMSGRLPSRLARLPLLVLALQDNPELRGHIPPDSATHDLVSIDIHKTRLNCHDSVLTRAEQTAATQRLLTLQHPMDGISQLPVAQAERACTHAASQHYEGPYPLHVSIYRLQGVKLALSSCEAPWLKGTQAMLTERYILSIGCLCEPPLQRQPVRRSLREGGEYACRNLHDARCNVTIVFLSFAQT